MIRFVSFFVRPQDIDYITKNQSKPSSLNKAAYYCIPEKAYYWQHICQVGNGCNTEVVIKSLDDLDKVLLLISLGIDTKELQEMIDGDLLDTF